MTLDNLNTHNYINSPSLQARHMVPQDLGSSTTSPHITHFCFLMFQAALEFYGLPANYIRTFKQQPLLDTSTQLPIREKNGKPKMTLRACNAAHSCIKEQVAVWTQMSPLKGGPFGQARMVISLTLERKK